MAKPKISVLQSLYNVATNVSKGVYDAAISSVVTPPGKNNDIDRTVTRTLSRMAFYDVTLKSDGTEQENFLTALLINPTDIKVEKTQIVSKQLTRGGFALQYWGEDLPKVFIAGSTGYFGVGTTSSASLIGTTSNALKLQAFNLLKNRVFNGRSRSMSFDSSKEDPFKEQITYQGNLLIRIKYLTGVYDGYITNFNYAQSAAQPHAIDYDFLFTITEVKSSPTYGTSLW